jgi:fatty acid desaturase
MPLPDAAAYLTRDEIQRCAASRACAGRGSSFTRGASSQLAMVLFAWWPNPLTLVLGVMVVGGRQLGLAILMHDAAHGLLVPPSPRQRLGRRWLCGAPVVASMDLYRPYHLTHHRLTQQPDDPDLGLSAPFSDHAREPPSQDGARPHGSDGVSAAPAPASRCVRTAGVAVAPHVSAAPRIASAAGCS